MFGRVLVSHLSCCNFVSCECKPHTHFKVMDARGGGVVWLMAERRRPRHPSRTIERERESEGDHVTHLLFDGLFVHLHAARQNAGQHLGIGVWPIYVDALARLLPCYKLLIVNVHWCSHARNDYQIMFVCAHQEGSKYWWESSRDYF